MSSDTVIAIALLREELEKAASLVQTAQRLLSTGTMVDLSALEGKVRSICDRLAVMDPAVGRALVPAMEKLIDDLNTLSGSIEDKVEPPFGRDLSTTLAGEEG